MQMRSNFIQRVSAITLALGLSISSGLANTTVVNIDSGTNTPNTLVSNNGTTVLSAGNLLTNGDGTVIQLGYYSGATAGNNFSGTWVPLTGPFSGNSSYATTSVGDFAANGPGNGQFGLTNLVFDPAGGSVNGNNLPSSALIPLAVRFYNGTTIGAGTDGAGGNSTFFNAVSNDSWLWKTPGPSAPTPPTLNLSFENTGTKLQSGTWTSGGNLATSIAISAVPEPTRALLLGLGVLGLFFRRSRKER